MSEPPFDAGAVNAILICLFPGVTESIVGAPGSDHVVPETAVELEESPIILVARSKTLYAVLSLSPVTTIGEVVVAASINAPSFNEYLYVVIAVPPLFVGAVNAILICLFPPVTESMVGAPGTIHVVADSVFDIVESPTILVAHNNTLYSVLSFSPDTTMGDDVVDAFTNV
jgi:hypothetical protein